MGQKSVGGGRSSRGRAAPAVAQKKPKAKDTIRVLPHLNKAAVAKELKKQGLTVKNLRDVIGGTKGSKLVITEAGKGKIRVQITTQQYKIERVLVRTKTKKYIKNEFIHVFKSGTGLGAKIFSRQVKKAARLGYSKIKTLAAGSKNDIFFNGYSTWAKFGYNAHLTSRHKASLPAPYNKAKTVQGVMRMKGGRKAWEDHGSDFHGTFDLRKGSKSRKTLAAYLRKVREKNQNGG